MTAHTGARPLRGLVAAALAAMVVSPIAARAQAARPSFNIPPGPIQAALVAFAVQARMSVATDGAAGCGPTKGLSGPLRPADALARLLAGTGCVSQAIDARSVIVFKPRPTLRRREPLSAPPPSPAEQGQPNELNELIVTAMRRPLALSRAPYSASVVTGADLDAAGARDIGDVAPMVAGLTTTDLGPGRDKLFLRGLSDGPLTGETQSTVGIELDGARITYNAPDPDLRLADVERVEVLRGPQGALYGAGSIGGLVQIVTRKPDLDAWSSTLDASGSTTQGGAPGWSADGVLNIPISPGRLGLRIVGYDEREGGYIADASLGLRNVNDVARSGGRAQVEWLATQSWTVSASVVWQSINSADTHYANPLVGPLSRDVFLQEPHDNDFLQAGLRLEGRQPWGEISLTSSLMQHQFNSRYDASLALPLFAPGAAVAPSPFDETDGTQAIVNELTASSPDSGRLRWLAGVFQSASDDDLASTLSAPLGPAHSTVTAYRQTRSDSIDELAIYGQLTYQLNPRVAVTAGGRWFRYAITTQAATLQPLAGLSGSFAGASASTGFAPQAILRFQPSDDLTLYGQLSEGYRAGGFNTAGLVGQPFGAAASGAVPQRQYAGDELWNYEVGAKASLLGGRAQLRTAAFYMVWRGVQSDQLLPNGLPYTANLGDGRDFGAELEADIRLDDRWRAQANATLNEPDLTHPNPAFQTAPDNGLPGVSTFSGGASVSYRQPLGDGRSLRLEGAYAYVGSSRLTLDATTSAAMGDYAFGRFSAEFSDRGWTVGLFVRAPLTGLGDTFAYGNPFTFRNFPQTTPQRPATITFEISRQFP